MGGMALGSWLCARYSPRWRNLLLGYALTEAVVGLLALAFHGLFTTALAVSYDHVLPWLAGTPSTTAYRWALSALLILPASVLLGMTFPLMSAGVLRLFPGRPGRSIAMLYFTNSIGAAVGVLASGFFLVRLLGLPGTIRLAGAINLLLGAAVWLLVRKVAPPGRSATRPGRADRGRVPCRPVAAAPRRVADHGKRQVDLVELDPLDEDAAVVQVTPHLGTARPSTRDGRPEEQDA